ncbi:MAG: hypothetical protein RH949_15290 [Coleofasciculus sp. A1-SPW-01]|uniref:tetratricopeptide repeat protein n=1 Tax=Coleofasciculus sp. A1-SPW-01 TaxID=3070819 RepID=UPI0032F1A820
MRKLTGKLVIAFMIALVLVFVFSRPGQSVSSGSNLIVAMQPFGQVKIKRSRWREYKSASIGTFVYSNDRLLVSSNASAQVLCRNRKLWQVPKGRESIVHQGCGRTPPNPEPENLDSADSRERNQSGFPYIIAPRKTSIVDTRPTLQWNAVPGVSDYQVEVVGPQLYWTISTRETSIKYSGETPLQPGSHYWLVVKTESGESSLSEGVFGFTVLSESEKAEILLAREDLQQKQLGEIAEVVALADLYQSNNLKGAAINQLEAAIRDEIESVAIYRLLGKVYQQVGLNRLAKDRYLKGLELAEQAEDIESQAVIQGNLSLINVILGEPEEGRQQLEMSQRLYQELGDTEKARQFEEKFRNISPVS